MTQSHAELRSIRDSVALVGRLSDSLVRLGPFSLGIDGVLSWVPGLGDLYSTLAGGFIVIQGARAGAPGLVLAGAALLIGCRTLVGAVPVAGSAFADFFTAHKWAAAMIVRAIDERLGMVTEAGDPIPRAPIHRNSPGSVAQA
ncbi:DUF4112 domain-containing protein [Phenylobacterium sp.]|uniref:DUF4112 domain-containing protein n=1 Tax=Phenylobacterium sp. TaxID=1871053 RepID=UPI00120620D9|nr:DUF4112 domain-containing protein [Phenylobacterium sp.]THD63629.1 MAG: DUF4112 domain-containing protein [Phenylobacterium sp.]